jgi:hypothetical protein
MGNLRHGRGSCDKPNRTRAAAPAASSPASTERTAFDQNGYPPFTVQVGHPRLVDVNVTVFSVLLIILIVGAALIARGAPLG